MRIPARAVDRDIGFEGLERRLERLDGEEVCLVIGYTPEEGSVVVFGGIRGPLQIVTEKNVEQARADFGGYRLPIDIGGAVAERGEKELLFNVGEAVFAASSAELRGASDEEGRLSFQLGSMTVNIEVAPGGVEDA